MQREIILGGPLSINLRSLTFVFFTWKTIPSHCWGEGGQLLCAWNILEATAEIQT